MKTDLNYLKTMSGGDKELINEMIDIFKSQVDEFSQEFQKLLKQEEYAALGKLAHKAKSSVAIMGMNKLANQLKELELLTKKGEKKEKYHSYVDYFKAECEIAVKELDAFQKSMH